jgi:hypothetical protein
MTTLTQKIDEIAKHACWIYHGAGSECVAYPTDVKKAIYAGIEEALKMEPSDKMLMCWGHEWITGQAYERFLAMRAAQWAEIQKEIK